MPHGPTTDQLQFPEKNLTASMSGVAEASLVLGLVSSIIAIIDATKRVYDAANGTTGKCDFL